MITVIVDTREQKPWTFSKSSMIETVRLKLSTGDYSIDGLQNIFCIERKKSITELARNIIEKRFERELQRMEKYVHKFLILEFDYSHIEMFPKGTHIPKNKYEQVKIRGPFIMKKLSEIQVDYNIHVIPCKHAKYAEHVASNLIKRIYDRYE